MTAKTTPDRLYSNTRPSLNLPQAPENPLENAEFTMVVKSPHAYKRRPMKHQLEGLAEIATAPSPLTFHSLALNEGQR